MSEHVMPLLTGKYVTDVQKLEIIGNLPSDVTYVEVNFICQRDGFADVIYRRGDGKDVFTTVGCRSRLPGILRQ